MANRCDFNSKLPRQIKKLLALSSIRNGLSKNAARRDRQDWLSAHKHHQEVRRKRLSSKGEESVAEPTEETVAG
jgi:hypothetical protein